MLNRTVPVVVSAILISICSWSRADESKSAVDRLFDPQHIVDIQITIDVFNESGTVASRCNFAQVTVNGRSLGIYSNVESVKPAMLKRGFGDGSGALFEGTLADFAANHVNKCERVVFRQVGAVAHPSQDRNLPDQNGRRPPAISLTGVRKDGKQLTFAIGFDAAVFHPTKKPIRAFGVAIEGNIVWFVARAVMDPMSLTFVDVEAAFEEAGMESDDAVRGEMQLRLIKFAGGKAPTQKWETK